MLSAEPAAETSCEGAPLLRTAVDITRTAVADSRAMTGNPLGVLTVAMHPSSRFGTHQLVWTQTSAHMASSSGHVLPKWIAFSFLD